jgi:hypothetical protein
MKQVSVAWFTADTWQKLLKVAADRANLPDTFAEFEEIAGRKFDRLCAQGIPVEKVLVSVDEMAAFCHAHGLALDSNGRAIFAAFVAARRAGAH